MADCEPRVTELEIKVTYQDELIETLNQVVIELRRELEAALQRLTKLEQQVLLGVPDEAANEPPPHY
jgi:SlyX protein